jgi:CubicO group peptidase (beta-lactamase class C family)
LAAQSVIPNPAATFADGGEGSAFPSPFHPTYFLDSLAGGEASGKFLPDPVVPLDLPVRLSLRHKPHPRPDPLLAQLQNDCTLKRSGVVCRLTKRGSGEFRMNRLSRSSILLLLSAVSLPPVLAARLKVQTHAPQSPARTIRRLDGSAITPAEIDSTVTRLMRAAKVTGIGIALFNNRTVAYLKAYGMRDTERNLPLTPDSVMTAASLSKSTFAYMVMQLVQEKRLDLDKPVYEYLPKPLPQYPAYKDLAGDPRYKLITARMLLDHTSGFPNWRWFQPDRKLNINFQPGTRFAYSGEGIDLLQLVVETIMKKPLGELMRERIFLPFGMARTSMTWEPRFESNYANGYDEHGKSLGPERRKEADAAGSMQTTLRDFSRLVVAVMQGRGLSKQMRDAMLSPQIQIFSKHEFPSLSTETTDENRSIRLSYGLGWGLFWTPYGKVFFKEGHDEGWRHYVVCFDRAGKALLIMTNSSNGEGIYKELEETLLRNRFTPIEWEGFTPYNQK